MTSKQAYKLFLTDFNKLDRNSDVEVTMADFVLMFNREQRRYTEETVPAHNSGVEIQDLRNIIVPEVKLTPVRNTPRFREFTLPVNFFRTLSSYSVCAKGACTGIPVTNNYKDIRPQNLETILRDPLRGPSFEYQDTPVTYMGGKMQVYKRDFTISEQYVSYYKFPVDIDIAGYRKTDGSLSADANPELPDNLVEKIIDRVVKKASGIISNAETFQVAQERIQTEP